MPVHLTSRRQFITQLGAAMGLSNAVADAADVDEGLIAILNDTHIGAQQAVPQVQPPHRPRDQENKIRVAVGLPEMAVIAPAAPAAAA